MKPENMVAAQTSAAPLQAGVTARSAVDAAARNAPARPDSGLTAPPVKVPLSAQILQAPQATPATKQRARTETAPAAGIMAGAPPTAGGPALANATVALNNAGAGISAATVLHAVHPDGAALAAAISAMEKSGSMNAVLKLSPENLGHVAIHIGVAANSLVNVSFIAAVPQTVQVLHNNLNDLRQAMAAAGLTLGQASIGGGGSEGSGTNAGTPQPEAQKNYSAASQTPETAMAAGVRAVA